MEEFAGDVRLGAQVDLCVLISGPFAAGSRAVALMIHGQSWRRRAPLVTMHCETIPAARQVSEFRAHADLAQGGTLLLEDVDRIGSDLQKCLLDFLQTRATAPRHPRRSIAARVMATTTGSLFERVVADDFSTELFYRLNAICITVPEVSSVPESIPSLADQMLRALSALHGIAPARISGSAMAILQSYDWPGNLGELRDVLESLLISRRGQVIGPDHLPAAMSAQAHEKSAKPRFTADARPLS